MSDNINTKSMLRRGTILHGTYRIDGYLSSGGFGNTYIATNIEFDERYAIKEFFMKGVSQRDGNNTTVSVSNAENETTFAAQKEKFKKEARRLRKLHNEHIVHVYDLFEENGTAYYVMDYIDGMNLSNKLKQLGHPIPEKAVLKILNQVLDALDTAHNYRDGDKQGILHLDLKPANIMLDSRGVVKLIDFGASKQQSASGGATTSSAISYTNGYAPLEQMDGNLEKFGTWTDFYALGATLYTLLTDSKPPLPSDINEDLSEDKHLSLPMPSTISGKTKHLVLWLMETNRKKRPQNVEDIRRYLNSDDETKMSGNGSDMGKPPYMEADGEGETLISGEKNDAPNDKEKDILGANNPQPSVSPVESKTPDRSGKVIAIGCSVTIIAFFIFMAVAGKCSGNKNQTAAPVTDTDSIVVDSIWADTAAVDTAMSDTYVSQVQCHVLQGDCTYTGYVNEDNVPNGEGEAWFNDGRYYKGYFANGMMVDDNAFFRFKNGDTYQGSFVNDHFSNGRYTIASDKSYFEGTYDSNGQPKKGAWYDKNGKKIENV